MRSNYSLLSQELNDVILQSQEHLIYLLGVEIDGVQRTGLYDRIEESGLAYMVSQSGIPHIGFYTNILGTNTNQSFDQIKTLLQFDYIYRKYNNMIIYPDEEQL